MNPSGDINGKIKYYMASYITYEGEKLSTKQDLFEF